MADAPASRKRPRDDTNVAPAVGLPETLRAELVARGAEAATPEFWRQSAAAAGATSADAFLCHLGRSKAPALRNLEGAAAAARACGHPFAIGGDYQATGRQVSMLSPRPRWPSLLGEYTPALAGRVAERSTGFWSALSLVELSSPWRWKPRQRPTPTGPYFSRSARIASTSVC